MTLEEIKSKLSQSIEQNTDRIIDIAETVLRHPEIGYREENTSALVRAEISRLGLSFQYPLAVTGVRATLHGKESGPNVCIIGEMDALKCAGHPFMTADGTAHACGHHAQIAAMLGTAMALKESGVMEELSGSVTFFAVPAEEFIDLDFRRTLKQGGKIRYFGGKQELIATGAFDDIDLAMMIHAQPNEEQAKIYTRGHNLGFVAKTITFHGKAAHGSTPYDGTNALNAAALAILGVHANRETFRDEDKIRIHPIITKGGDVVNSVPDEVCIDTYVRGATFAAIRKGSDAVHRAVMGAAQMIGATAEIDTLPGYLPLCESSALNDVFGENAAAILGAENVISGAEITGSTDMGDLSALIPVIQPSMGGFHGNLHANDFTAVDPAAAYIAPVRMMAATVADLLWDGAQRAQGICKAFQPLMTKEEYIQFLQGE